MATNFVQQFLQSKEKDKQTGFTYDEGKGKTDTIAITGPLSEVYTQALNVAFTKKEVGESDEGEGGSTADAEAQVEEKIAEANKVSENLSVAKESQALDSAVRAKVITSVMGAIPTDVPVETMGNVNFIDTANVEASDPEATNATAFIVDKNDALKPDIIDQVQASAATGRKTMLVVVANPYGQTQGMRLMNQFVDLGENPTYSDVELGLAAESLYTAHGVHFYKNMGEFIRSFVKK